MSPLPNHGPRNEELVWRRWEWSPSNATPTDLYYVLMERGETVWRRAHSSTGPGDFPANIWHGFGGEKHAVYVGDDPEPVLFADLEEAKRYAEKRVAEENP